MTRYQQKIRKLAREFDRRIASLPVGFTGEALPILQKLPVRPTGSSLSNLKARCSPKSIGWPENHD